MLAGDFFLVFDGAMGGWLVGWHARHVKERKRRGHVRGFLWSRHPDGRRPKLSEHAEDYFGLLELAQEQTKLIDKNVDIRESPGLKRSDRRGVDNHATSVGAPEDLIELINRWRSELRMEGKSKHKKMIHLCTRLTELHLKTVKFSWSL